MKTFLSFLTYFLITLPSTIIFGYRIESLWEALAVAAAVAWFAAVNAAYGRYA